MQDGSLPEGTTQRRARSAAPDRHPPSRASGRALDARGRAASEAAAAGERDACERRAATREPAAFSVFLFRHDSVLAIGEALEVSCQGMLVAPLPRFAEPLPPGAPLEVGLGVEQGAITRRFRIPARVVHQHARGVGLAFEAEDAAFVATVTRALTGPSPAF